MSYTLPAVPAHLITSPPSSPNAGASLSSANLGAPATAAASSTTSSPSSLLAGNGFNHPLAKMLDTAAVERLREFRSKAEAEVFELVRQKRREMEALEKRTKEEAEALLEATRTRRTPSGGLGGASLMAVALGSSGIANVAQGGIGNNLNGTSTRRGRGSSVAAPEGVRSRDFGAAAASSPSPSPTQRSHGYPAIGDHDQGHDDDLPPSAFERRPTAAQPSGSSSGARAPNMSTSLSALSASFAMRGRDAPAQLEDWASKRRLRERYPEGDHSALTSAVNSTANSLANSTDHSGDEVSANAARGFLRSDRHNNGDSRERLREMSNDSVDTQDDQELAGRGRSRGRGASLDQGPAEVESGELRDVHAAARPEPEAAAEPASSRGRSGRSAAPSQLAPPAVSSSLRSKAAASVLVDDGKLVDDDTPQVGGKLISPQSAPQPSAEVTLRPRNPPPTNTEPLRPATRGANESAAAADASTSSAAVSSANAAGDKRLKAKRSTEKKVAFAEAEDTVGSTLLSDDDGDDDDEVAEERELVDETDGELSSNASTQAPARRHHFFPLESAQLMQNRSLSSSTDLFSHAHTRSLSHVHPFFRPCTAAVFEIDEEGQESNDSGAVKEDDADVLEPQADPQPGVRRGISGQVRGQGDDSLLGDDDDYDEDGSRGATDQDDDEDSSHASLDRTPGFGAASFSALAARESATANLATSLARADDSGFDPASLRLDGRVVPETAAGFNEGLDDGFMVGSASKQHFRGLSGSFRPSSISRGRRTSIADAAVAAAEPSGSAAASGSAAHRSGSRSRNGGSGAKKSAKEIADTEIRLSVAPNAPSHRGLWSPKDAKSQRSGKYKYRLDEEDDQKWAAWQRKIRESDSAQPDEADAMLGRSVPMDVAPPARFLAAGGAIGGRPMRGPTLGGPSRTDAMSLASSSSSQAVGGASALAIGAGRRVQGYGYGSSFYDNKSGFDCEPKTSLPYKEKMLVPSLRKAIRRSTYELNSKLETIEDGAEAEVSPHARVTDSDAAASLARPIPTSSRTGTADDAKPANAAAAPRGALSGNVVTKGFVVPGSQPAQGEAKPAATLTYRPLAAPSAAATDASTTATATATAQRTVSDSVVLTKEVGGSATGTSTPTSSSRRSPRPPYERPPPPTSYDIRLVSDPSMAPKPLKVFEVEEDKSFSLYEEGEEEETEEGWQKTLQFLHTLEKLKTNPRTGWLHHRVRTPESIAEHMYRMGVMALMLPREADVDIGKCVMLALVHDLAEAEVGDLTPLDRVPKVEKMRREHEAILYFAHDLLGSSAAGLRIEELWNEYEERKTKESKLVKDLDRFELCLQAVEYERREGINDLQAFFEGSLPEIRHPRVRRWAVELAKERREMWRQRGVEFEQPIEDV
ncbi:hypothetical protein ACQY0O_005423 [Thecaphora frezii]